MRRARFAAVGIAIGCAGIAATAEAEVSCPDQLSVQQHVDPPSGWSVAYVEAPARLSGVTIFDGPPANRVSLKYDGRRQSSKELTVIWNLRDTPRSHYLLCSYDRTTAQVSTALPPGSRRCEVVFDRTSAGPGGVMPVKRMVCK